MLSGIPASSQQSLAQLNVCAQVIFSVANLGPTIVPPYKLAVGNPNYTDVSSGVSPSPHANHQRACRLLVLWRPQRTERSRHFSFVLQQCCLLARC